MEKPEIKYDRWLIHAPLLCAAIAVAFDVGYFWGIDINYFTLFSLSEHVLFAIEALPNALVIVLLIWVAIAAAASLVITVRQILAVFGVLFWIPRIDFDYARIKERFSSNPQARRRHLFFLLIRVAVGSILFYVIVRLASKFWGGIGIVGVVLSIYLLASFLFVGRLRVILLGIAFGIVSVAGTFSAGYLSAKSYLADKSLVHEFDLKGTVVAGKLIRSGKRGVLFLRFDNNMLVFKPWRDVEQISGPHDGIKFHSSP